MLDQPEEGAKEKYVRMATNGMLEGEGVPIRQNAMTDTRKLL
jgi:hypothetical protein